LYKLKGESFNTLPSQIENERWDYLYLFDEIDKEKAQPKLFNKIPKGRKK